MADCLREGYARAEAGDNVKRQNWTEQEVEAELPCYFWKLKCAGVAELWRG